MKRKIIIFFIVILIVLIAFYICGYHYKNRVITYDDSDVGKGNAATIARLCEIYEYLHKQQYMDRGHLASQYLHIQSVNERIGILLDLYEKGFFKKEDFAYNNISACNAQDYTEGIRTMMVLGRLLEEYTSDPESYDIQMARQMVAYLSVWAASFPNGFLVGNEGMIRMQCAILNHRLLE